MPELTKRTCSAQGIASTIRSPNSTAYSFWVKNVVPRAIAAPTAAMTRGWACPSTIGPEPSR